MAKYKEVHDKQNALENMADREERMSKGLFVGFTFKYVRFPLLADIISSMISSLQDKKGCQAPEFPYRTK